MPDLNDAVEEIREFLTNTAAQDATLVGLVHLANTIGEKIDDLGYKLDETNKWLETLVEAVRATVPPL